MSETILEKSSFQLYRAMVSWRVMSISVATNCRSSNSASPWELFSGPVVPCEGSSALIASAIPENTNPVMTAITRKWRGLVFTVSASLFWHVHRACR